MKIIAKMAKYIGLDNTMSKKDSKITPLSKEQV